MLAPMWTEAQAESITTIRGLPVRVRHCDGLGGAQKAGGVVVYRRFACLAGARIRYQPIDTVAITYVLSPRGEYEGASSAYALTDVHFGGLGVP